MADYDDDDDLKDLKENRFAFLLKPIRDLQDNFNVDLAHELEEYLEQLENAQFVFEGAKPGVGMVDFAEAALLIQGSMCVYSKKVEYLFNLVYQALEAVKGRKRQQALGPDGQPLEGEATQAAPRGRGAAARGGDADDDADGLERFWDVEPLLKESADLDLAPGDGLLPAAGTSVRPPAALLALEDHGQGAASSTSGKSDGDSGVFRLQQCVVHCSGALLLDTRDGDMYDQELRFIGQRHRAKELQHATAASQMDIHPTQLMPLPPTQAHAPGPGPAPAQQEPAPNGAADAAIDMDQGGPSHDDYDDGGGGGGDSWQSDDEGGMGAPAEGAGDVPHPAPEATGTGTAAHAPEEAAAQEGPGRQKQPRKAACQARQTYVALAGAGGTAGPIFDRQDAAAADEAANAEEADAGGPPARDYDGDDGFGGGGGGSDIDDDANPFGAAADGAWPCTADGGGAGGEGGLFGGPGRFPGAGGGVLSPLMARLSGAEAGMAVDGAEQPSYEELCRAHMESLLCAAAAREVQSDLARRVSSWRQRIDPAEEARPAFDIQDYGERLLGRLQAVDSQVTDQRMVEAEGGSAGLEAGLRIAFANVALNMQKFEVSRMFSAMLQLINNRNVAIFKASESGLKPGEVPTEPFTLTLLSIDMYHKSMGARLAAPPPRGGGASPGGGGGADNNDQENRATQHPLPRQAKGRGKAGGVGKRAKKAAALADSDADD
ncbi:Condensin-2 complex subunit H2 [Tetrabaena socialis]|uniref:Condensin-2 complex subunit H2 n=1 Tax=Tetrabaena socialis TaxID=47790 RepID=A0A2J7ZZ99_9CHLO|nr:Condensin-2 complex subunit H2 [Tetrabaena socialis]|eukprot:PNH05578.1 Condensin-2 complex subunit H2 [Tetrabaena socialis]